MPMLQHQKVAQDGPRWELQKAGLPHMPQSCLLKDSQTTTVTYRVEVTGDPNCEDDERAPRRHGTTRSLPLTFPAERRSAKLSCKLTPAHSQHSYGRVLPAEEADERF